MNIVLRQSHKTDHNFLKEMLYEAVYWRTPNTRPSFEDALADPEVNKAVADLGSKEGDISVIALIDSVPAGAAWLRYWTNKNNIRGYINENIPVLVIGVHSKHRRLGVGKMLIDWLVNYASNHFIPKISLCVSKDNHALYLYEQKDFIEHSDIGDSLLMIREIQL